eukprot:CAMPEP_0184319144 /NCGR_PEP_ID=MMETSP1049-20130417/106730_1 /TAXON_ID=77928 /ORGANISM="Proteomonas sulcata, Strain CCMP704" /LENGTH=41 /DNA_ID= /DNA_START= /DNA_END= /DNA_ORIENTATION=
MALSLRRIWVFRLPFDTSHGSFKWENELIKDTGFSRACTQE